MGYVLYSHDCPAIYVAKLIIQMPTCFMLTRDKLMWSLTANGIYSVRTIYREIMSQFRGLEELKIEGTWGSLWKIQVPPKVKIFFWKPVEIVSQTVLSCRAEESYVQLSALYVQKVWRIASTASLSALTVLKHGK